MMHCRPVGLAMMGYSPADIPPEVLSLADEVDERNARNHTGRVQEDEQQLSGAALDWWSKSTF